MPAVKWIRRDLEHEELGCLIAGTVALRGYGAAKVAAILGTSENTARARIKNPGSLTVDEMTKLGRGLGIPIEKLRDAIQY